MKRRVILISGLSGAGKTSVSNVLEDLGFRCIDQLPSFLFKDLLNFIEKDESGNYQNVAVTVSLLDLGKFLYVFENLHFDARVLLLDAESDILLNRYKFTRRIHPLLVSNKADTLEEAIAIEKEELNKYKEMYDVINTTRLGTYELKDYIEKLLKIDNVNKFTISFVSFGFKNGLPKDADLVFDVRFLDNPFYIDELKELTGNDKEVYDYVLSKAKTKEYLKILNGYLDYSFNEYVKEGKRHLTVAIGCTGGQHRSATLVNYLYDRYKVKYNCFKSHRDIKK